MKKVILAFTLGASIASAASAQDGPPLRGPGVGMMHADTNGDGIVTRAEALAEASARFDRIDANHDGKLDRPELAAMPMRRGRGGDTPPAQAPTPVK
jgi:hypothetical protein